MKYAVVGAGAVGSFVGGMLARAGADVTLIGRRAHVEAVGRDGLEIAGLVGPYRVRLGATESLDGARGADVVLLCVKSQDTTATCGSLASSVGAAVPIVSLQNGVRNVSLIDASPLGAGRGIGGTVAFNAVFGEPGRVLYTTSGGLILGATSRDGRFGPVMDEMGRDVRRSGVPVRVTPHVDGVLWSKLLINLNNAIGALTGQTTAEAVEDRTARLIAAALVEEGIRVCGAAGIRLETIPRVDPHRLLKILKMDLPGFVTKAILRFLVKIHPEARGSTWQSLAKGQKTEIDFLNGEIVRVAAEHGIEAPYNRAIVELIREAEALGRPPDLPSAEIARRMGLPGT